MGKELFEQIMKLVKDNNIDHEYIEHEHVVTSHDAAKIRGTDLSEAAKAIVLKSASGKFIQCIVPGDKKIDLKKMKLIVGEKNLSLAPPDEVLQISGCTVGSVPPFGNLFGIPVFCERSLLEKDRIVFSAGTHNDSLRMSPKDWEKLVNPKIVDLIKLD